MTDAETNLPRQADGKHTPESRAADLRPAATAPGTHVYIATAGADPNALVLLRALSVRRNARATR